MMTSSCSNLETSRQFLCGVALQDLLAWFRNGVIRMGPSKPMFPADHRADGQLTLAPHLRRLLMFSLPDYEDDYQVLIVQFQIDGREGQVWEGPLHQQLIPIDRILRIIPVSDRAASRLPQLLPPGTPLDPPHWQAEFEAEDERRGIQSRFLGARAFLRLAGVDWGDSHVQDRVPELRRMLEQSEPSSFLRRLFHYDRDTTKKQLVTKEDHGFFLDLGVAIGAHYKELGSGALDPGVDEKLGEHLRKPLKEITKGNGRLSLAEVVERIDQVGRFPGALVDYWYPSAVMFLKLKSAMRELPCYQADAMGPLLESLREIDEVGFKEAVLLAGAFFEYPYFSGAAWEQVVTQRAAVEARPAKTETRQAPTEEPAPQDEPAAPEAAAAEVAATEPETPADPEEQPELPESEPETTGEPAATQQELFDEKGAG